MDWGEFGDIGGLEMGIEKRQGWGWGMGLALVATLLLWPYEGEAADGLFLTVPGEEVSLIDFSEQTPSKFSNEKTAPSKTHRAERNATVQVDQKALHRLLGQASYGVHQVPLKNFKLPKGSLVPSLFFAANPRQRFGTLFAPHGIRVGSSSNNGKPWACIFQIYGFGYAEDLKPVQKPKRVIRDQRVEYQHDGFIAWYENTSEGLSQGFSIEKRPDHDDDFTPSGLLLKMILLSNLKPESTAKQSALHLSDPHSKNVIELGKILATDASGHPLTTRLNCHNRILTLEIGDQRALYPVTIFSRWVTQNRSTSSKAEE